MAAMVARGGGENKTGARGLFHPVWPFDADGSAVHGQSAVDAVEAEQGRLDLDAAQQD